MPVGTRTKQEETTPTYSHKAIRIYSQWALTTVTTWFQLANEYDGSFYPHLCVEVHLLSRSLVATGTGPWNNQGANWMVVDLCRPLSYPRRGRLSPALRRQLLCGRCPANEAGAMPVPAGYFSDSPAAAFSSSASLIPPPPINTQQPGAVTSLLYSGSKFRGHQKSKGNSYDVEVVLQVGMWGGEPSGAVWWSVKWAVGWLTTGKSISLGLSTYLASWDFSKPWLACYLRYVLSVLLLSAQHMFWSLCAFAVVVHDYCVRRWYMM